jgi:hypothetical protein
MTETPYSRPRRRGQGVTRHHAECLVEFAQAACGDMSDVELLRHLRDLRSKWDTRSLRTGDARFLAVVVVERARRLGVRSKGGAS